MKTKGLKPPVENTKNKFDMPVFSKDRTIDNNQKNNVSEKEKIMIPNLMELIDIKISNEKKFVMDTEF